MDNCPVCKSSFIGEKIPDDIKHHYVGTHWRKEIAIDGGFLGIYDGTVAVRCPECESEFPRDESKWALDIFLKYKSIVNCNM
jgi:hypothetical protein